MRKIMLVLVSAILLCGCTVLSEENEFPSKEIKGIEVVELHPNYLTEFEDYVKNDFRIMSEYHWWSTLHPHNLPKFNLTTFASSTLNNSKSYVSGNLCDGKAETAWVEGIAGPGIGEWVKISIDASESFPDNVTNNPFSMHEIGVIPGYAKSPKTWAENNRVKRLLVVAHSPKIAEKEWVAYRLHLTDENKMQVFKIPGKKVGTSLETMKKEIWIKIEDVYKGTKYDDTCISEFVAVGGYTN